MSVETRSLTVTTTRQAITPPVTAYGYHMWLYGEFHGSSKHVAFGGADVTSSNGLHLYAAEKFGPIYLGPTDTLHVVSNDALGLDLRVLIVGA